MGSTSSWTPPLGAALRLGRVANLPTVWSNVLAGSALAGKDIADHRLPLLLAAFSLFYLAGMYLNDAFDHSIDARERPERPIPSGLIARRTVIMAGLAMMTLGLLTVSAVGGFAGFTAGLALGVTIIGYDLHHKGNRFGPVLMGVCRGLVYLGSTVALTGRISLEALAGGVILLCYVLGLTYTAKRETLASFGAIWPLASLAAPMLYFPRAFANSAIGVAACLLFAGWLALTMRKLMPGPKRDVRAAVGQFIAGIALVDTVIAAACGQTLSAALAVLAFLTTLLLHRRLPGT
ncbi:UbiA family prenyltransferase [Telmatospirillum siberiense]|uniref:Prenyltransferase n=1 Tax=Telmatospirillum siberiense TaxID=382514 RepID=A0A2N3PZT0_9PROT|nr:UbiA family prenyltransferase [Telmatospirillum siberiense]PKU25908.1 prenyltransferase [Telmatospirillum siberiense]